MATDTIVGDVNRQSPDEIWRGEPRRKLIAALNQGKLEGKCLQCIKFTGNEVSAREVHIRV